MVQVGKICKDLKSSNVLRNSKQKRLEMHTVISLTDDMCLKVNSLNSGLNNAVGQPAVKFYSYFSVETWLSSPRLGRAGRERGRAGERLSATATFNRSRNETLWCND